MVTGGGDAFAEALREQQEKADQGELVRQP
jgi:hypothetical protein